MSLTEREQIDCCTFDKLSHAIALDVWIVSFFIEQLLEILFQESQAQAKLLLVLIY